MRILKRAEHDLGFRRTKNFRKDSMEAAVSYRCFYTGKLELPESYTGLRLVLGTKAGCPVDGRKYDVFFYPMQANASGKTPLSAGLADASTERLMVVVPHEDFHATKELRRAPMTWSEAAATLVGMATAAEVARQQFGPQSEVYQNLEREPEQFARKAALVNGYHARLRALYEAARAGRVTENEALAQKEQMFAELHRQCMEIEPAPKSFSRCLAVENNAGLAFDATYTQDYPKVYQIFLSNDRDVKRSIAAIKARGGDEKP